MDVLNKGSVAILETLARLGGRVKEKDFRAEFNRKYYDNLYMRSRSYLLENKLITYELDMLDKVILLTENGKRVAGSIIAIGAVLICRFERFGQDGPGRERAFEMQGDLERALEDP